MSLFVLVGGDVHCVFLTLRFLRTPEVVKEELIPQDPKGPRSAGAKAVASSCAVAWGGGEERNGRLLPGVLGKRP